MFSDAEMLCYIMEKVGLDGFVHVSKDRYEYAIDVAAQNGRVEPTTEDELIGFRRMVSCAMSGGDMQEPVEFY
jgi:hypothetical protein